MALPNANPSGGIFNCFLYLKYNYVIALFPDFCVSASFNDSFYRFYGFLINQVYNTFILSICSGNPAALLNSRYLRFSIFKRDLVAVSSSFSPAAL